MASIIGTAQLTIGSSGVTVTVLEMTVQANPAAWAAIPQAIGQEVFVGIDTLTHHDASLPPVSYPAGGAELLGRSCVESLESVKAGWS